MKRPSRRRVAVHLGLLFAVTAGVAPWQAGASTGTPTAAHVDASLTSQLRSAMNARRAAAGLESLIARPAYVSLAKSMAIKLANGQSVTDPADRTPATWVSWSVPEATLRDDARDAISAVASALRQVLAYKLHTDGGWAVAVRTDGLGGARLGVVGLVGWPDPAIASNGGCSSSKGFCWSARGVNPHLPWTRNVLRVHLSTAGLPAAGESLVRAAIARIAAVPGVGVDVRYGGRTSATTSGDGHRFLVQWGTTSACGSGVLACTLTDTQGSYKMVFGARMVVLSSRYAANPRAEAWIGTIAHEIGHALGLGHFDVAYGGGYQLMRWAGGPNAPRSGDGNGLRILGRPGRLSATLRAAAPAFRSGTRARVTVNTWSSGLGGVRGVAVQCRDRSGRVQTVTRRAGTWDIRGREHAFSWVVPSGSSYASSCRAYVTSRAARGASAWVPVRFGG